MSTQVTINDTPPKTQITATAGQTVFTTNWTANAASDVVVYARTSSQVPDDLTQLVNSANYTVAFIGGQEVVEITFLVARAAGDVITITRDTPADRLNLYINTNFTPSMLNQDIGILTLVDQQAQLYNNQVAPHYNVSATPDLGDPISGLGGDIYLPILGANEGWKKNSANTAIEAMTFPSGGGLAPSDATYIVQTPWSPSGELPNQQALSPLATGFMSSVTGTGVVSTRTLQPTSNQIDITNTNGTGNPVFSLSSTLQLPGTMQFGGNVDANGYDISNIGVITGGTWQGNTIGVAYGGTGNTSVGANGTIAQSDGTVYTFTTATYPSTTTVNNILFSSATNVVGEISSAVGGVLVSDATGVPSMLANPTDNYRVLQSKNAAIAEWSVAAYPHTAGATGTLMQSDGTDWTNTQATYPSSTNKDHILYSSANNTVGEIATQKDAVLVSNHTNTPVWSSSMTDGQIIIGKTNDIPAAANLTAGTGISITNGNNSITITNTSTASGQVNAGTANQLAYYATTGSAVSGLTTANNGVLITSAGGVPSISSTLPTAVQGNITSVGTIGSGTWNGGTIPVSYGGTGATTLTGYVKGNGTSAFTASSTIPNTDITGLGTMSTQNANSVAITGGTATLTSAGLTSGTVTNTPSAATDIANKAYVDSVAQGLSVKAPAQWGTTANITLFGLGTQAGGEWTGSLTAGDRILVKNQATSADNGIYSASAAVWTRTSDADTWNDLVSAFVFVEQGATLADTSWVCTVDPGGTLGVTPVTWVQFSGAGTYTAGTGLTLTGNQFSITNTGVTANSYGGASSVPTFTVNAQGQLTVASSVAVVAPAGTLSGTTLAANVVSSSLTSVGTITSGVWNGTLIGVTYGGTGLSTLPTNGQLLIGNGSGYSLATLSAGSGINITNGAGSITIASSTGGLSWTTLSGTTQTAAVNSGYVSGNAAQTTITLPATCGVGDVVAVEGLGAGGWVLAANTGQTIKIGSSTTASAGSLTSAAASDNIYVTCIVANTTWRVRTTNSAGLTIA